MKTTFLVFFTGIYLMKFYEWAHMMVNSHPGPNVLEEHEGPKHSTIVDVNLFVIIILVMVILNSLHFMRYLKKYVPFVFICGMIYRYSYHASLSNHNYPSINQSLLYSFVDCIQQWYDIPLKQPIGYYLGEIFGLAAVYTIYKCFNYIVKNINQISSLESIIKIGKDAGFNLVKDLPSVVQEMKKEAMKMEDQLEAELKVNSRAIGTANSTLPIEGLEHKEILQLMKTETKKENVIWQDGKVSGAVYHGIESHQQLLNQAFGMYSISNPLHPDIWPSGMKFESEIIQMVASMMDGRNGSTSNLSEEYYIHNNNVCGSTTSGGTESIVLAIKAHRDYYRDVKGIDTPEMIACTSAHAAVNKACDMLGIKLVQVPMDTSNTHTYPSQIYGGETTVGGYRMSIKATIDAINMNTIMIYSSAPSYPQGVIDDIPTLSQIAIKYDIGLHVDCCLGGFVLPFAKLLQRQGILSSSHTNKKSSTSKKQVTTSTKSTKEGRSRSRSRKSTSTTTNLTKNDKDDDNAYEYGQNIPDFDFGLRGVTSMSVDTHKFGYALKGASVVLYGSKELRQAQYFCYADWTGGMYTTPTIAGSRSGGLIAQCWASMMALGENGYKMHTQEILDTTRKILRGCENIPGIKILGDSAAMIVCFASVDESLVNTYTVSDIMNKKFGWSLNTLQNPACIHICCTVRHVDREQEFVNDLTAAVEEARESIARGDQAEGKAAIYGMTSGMPAGPINELLKVYNDVVLKI